MKYLNLLPVRLWERRTSRRQEIGAAGSRHRHECGHSLDPGTTWQTGAQAGTQGTPVLLTLGMNTAGNGDTHPLTTAQQDVHKFDMRPRDFKDR